MRVLRGRHDDPASDAAATADLLDRTAHTGESGLRVWCPPRQLAFGRRDARAAGYERAREIADRHGFPPTERRSGGRGVAYTGSTVAFARTLPLADIRTGMVERYDAATDAVQRALWRLGVPAQRGEPPDAFCPGNHSLQWRGKLVGLAQRVRKDAALVGGIVIVRDHEAVAAVLEPVYAALSVPFDPESVGSIERAGGRADPDAAIDAIETVFVGDRAVTVERVTDGV